MLWWWPIKPSQSDNSLGNAQELLQSMTGTMGEPFSWSILGNRRQGGTDAQAAASPNYVVKLLPKAVVIVANKQPLIVNPEGASLLLERFKIMKGDLDIGLQGLDFLIGENMLVRMGRVKFRQLVTAEFCEIRWVASSSTANSGAYEEMALKLSLPENKEVLKVDFSAVEQEPFGYGHVALQMVHLYESAFAQRR